MLVLLGGLDRSGKTILITYFEQKYNVTIFSTSRLAHELASSILVSLLGHDIDLNLKESPITFNQVTLYPREILIAIAENAKKTLGDEVFANAVISHILPAYQSCAQTPIILETVGGREATYLRNALVASSIPFQAFNLRSLNERQDTPPAIRSLIPFATDLWHDFTFCTKSLAYEQIKKTLNL
jgi:hypothetical protein